MPSDYHHGDLPAALRSAAVELIAEAGPNGFSLREIARRAGVSHAAPAHHFGDAKGVLTSVATEGFELVAAQMAEATAATSNARDRLTACGTAYIRTALDNPGHYSVMIGHDYIDPYNDAFLTASGAAYEQLLETVYALRDEFDPDLDVDKTATLCWSAVHGLVELAPVLETVAEVTETSMNSINDLVAGLTELIIDGIAQRN